jgi:hypothetical protein
MRYTWRQCTRQEMQTATYYSHLLGREIFYAQEKTTPRRNTKRELSASKTLWCTAICLQGACRMHPLRRLTLYGVQETSHRTTTVQIRDEMIYSTVQLYTRDLRSYRSKVTGEGSPPSVGGTACDGTDHGHTI